MAINFCHPCLQPNIHCEQVCLDDYEATNLISSSPAKRRNGFMTEHFIKPPVTITLTFLCDVEISHISIHAEVGAQKSVVFEIANHGRSTINNEPGIVFRNARYQSKPPFLNFPVNKPCEAYHKQTLKHQGAALFRSKSIIIRILRTKGSSVPCLGSVEVWGQPTRSCSNDIKQHVLSSWLEAHSAPAEVPSISPQPLPEPEKTTDTSTEENVPYEFLDPITCAIMMYPVTLPCGQTVDQSTVDKYQRESGSGQARDPFTRKPFSSTCQPIFNAALKARIDMFMLRNSHRKEMKRLGRTVGSKRKESDQNGLGLAGHCSQNPDDVPAKKPCVRAPKCDKCGTAQSLIYKLSCGHLWCRSCVTSVKSYVEYCKRCNCTFPVSSITRFHCL